METASVQAEDSSKNDQNQQPQQPNPEQSPSKSPGKRQTRGPRSQTCKELRKCYVYKKAAGVYQDIRGRSRLLHTVTDRMEKKSQDLCQKVIRSERGQKADKLLAPVARTANVATRRISKFASRVGKNVGQVAVRYWPPTLITRWSVDASLGVSSVTLALMKDVFDITEAKPKEIKVEAEASGNAGEVAAEENAGEVAADENIVEGTDGTPVKPQQETPEADATPSAPENEVEAPQEGVLDESEVVREGEDVIAEDDASLKESWNESLEKFMDRYKRIGRIMEGCVNLVRMMMRLILMTFNPFVAYVTLILYQASNKLAGMSGLSEQETPEERKERVNIYARLVDTQTEEDQGQELTPLRKNQWLFDVVLDKQVGYLMKWNVIGKAISSIGIERPVQLAEYITDKINSILNQEGGLAVYLKDDPSYNEADDPDYRPEDDDEDYHEPLEFEADENLEPAVPTDNKEDTKTTRSSSPSKTRSGSQARSTQKNITKRGKEGSPTKEKCIQDEESAQHVDIDSTITLPPLSPEKLREVKIRGPIQAAVIRMKGDKIVEFQRRMRQAKQQRKKNKPKPRVIKKTNECDAIEEVPSDAQIAQVTNADSSSVTLDTKGKIQPKEKKERESELPNITKPIEERKDCENNMVHFPDADDGHAYEHNRDSTQIENGSVIPENNEPINNSYELFPTMGIHASNDNLALANVTGPNDMLEPTKSVELESTFENINVTELKDIPEFAKHTEIEDISESIEITDANGSSIIMEGGSIMDMSTSTRELYNTSDSTNITDGLNDIPEFSKIYQSNFIPERTIPDSKDGLTEYGTVPELTDMPDNTSVSTKVADEPKNLPQFAETYQPNVMPEFAIPESKDGLIKSKTALNLLDMHESPDGTSDKRSPNSSKRDFCGNPGPEYRNLLHLDDDMHSSSVDTGQTTF